jgi:hypothetical protein
MIVTVKVCSTSPASAALVGMCAVLALLVWGALAWSEKGLAVLGPGSGGGALRGSGIDFGGGMAALSSASMHVIRGVMATLMAAVISKGSNWSAADSAVPAAASWWGLAFATGFGSPMKGSGRSGAGSTFLGQGVDEGSIRGMGTVGGAFLRPLGMAKGEGCLAVRGGLERVGVGVESARVGVEPEAVRFLPATGPGHWPSNGPSKDSLRPRDSAADVKYEALRFLTTMVISASCAAAQQSIWAAFQSRHFSSSSAVASLAMFCSVLSLRLKYQSW